MALKLYKISELVAAAKAVIRGAPATALVGTEEGTDIDLTINAAARLFQGTQVAAAHVAQQLDLSPTDGSTPADAQRRDQLIDQLGLVFTRDATPARGLMAITFDPAVTAGGFRMTAGSEITFPAALFGDGVERTFRLLEDVNHGGYFNADLQLAVGSGIRKIVPVSADGVDNFYDRTLLIVKSDGGTATYWAAVRTANQADKSLDLIGSLHGNMTSASTNRLDQFVHNCVVAVECTTPGKIGNAPYVRNDFEATMAILPFALGIGILLEMGGGGDAIADIDPDTSRVVRLIEDTLAMPPSFGNLQHWREIALSCPDVDLDDAVVFQHVRGPGTIDIVCIGRSGSVRSSTYPDANLSFCFWGNNARRIGDVQAQVVERWCQSQASYFDDIKVRSIEWDWRGNTYIDNSPDAFLQAANGVVVEITPQDGYGPDCGASVDVVPHMRHATNLYAASSGLQIDPRLQPGHRVWVTVGHATSDVRHAFATVVTEILSISTDRTIATIADVSDLGPGTTALDGGLLQVLRWGSAGPLTQPVIDAVFAYYDQLGPGSYTVPPQGPGFVQHFQSGVAPALPGDGLARWPAEGRRWNSSLRASEIRAAIMAIPGVHGALLAPVGDDGGLFDFDPAVFKTLACNGVVALYG